MTPQASRQRDRIILMNREYKALTGEDFYLYCSSPAAVQPEIVFTDRVLNAYPAAVEHMKAALDQAKAAGEQAAQ